MTTAPHGLAGWVVAALAFVTLYGLYLVSLAARWGRRLVAAAREEAPACAAPAPASPAVPVARDTAPYRMDAGVAVSGAEPGRHESVEVMK